MNKKEQKQKSKLGAKSKIKLKNYNKSDKRFKQVHNENEVNKAMAELSDGDTKEVKESSIQELENDIQEILNETNEIESLDGSEDEIDFKERPKAPEPRWIKEGLSDKDYNKSNKSFRDKFLAGVVIGGLLALAFIDVFFNK